MPLRRGSDISNIEEAIERIQDSLQTHIAWAQHYLECEFCQEHPPEYVQPRDEQLKIIEEYENVLEVLFQYKDLND